MRASITAFFLALLMSATALPIAPGLGTYPPHNLELNLY
jgi:hypothetical protein